MQGGIRKNIYGYDFKYTLDITRKNWIQSVFPHVKTLIDIVANIPYNQYNYSGDIIYTTYGTLEEEEEGFTKSFVSQIKHELIKNYLINLPSENSLRYNFFGGICFELLNDIYPNVNLYDFVDPTSDIDIKLITTLNIDTNDMLRDSYLNYDKRKVRSKEYGPNYCDIDGTIKLVVSPTKVQPDLIPFLNPYFRHVSDFILHHMLVELNKLSLSFENSVPFDINEYFLINDSVKKKELGYTVIDIENSNAKLICYLDHNAIKIQIVLKIMVDNESILDHLLEFVLNPEYQYEKKDVWELQSVPISSLYILLENNVRAYNQRQYLLEAVGPKMHKPMNHLTRFIYLLDLIKKYPKIYFDIVDVEDILQHIMPSYSYYIIKNDKLIIKNIRTIEIIYAFYYMFKTTYEIIEEKLGENLKHISQYEEKQYYDKLINLFKINASPFRKFLSKKAEGNKKKRNKKTKRQNSKHYKKY